MLRHHGTPAALAMLCSMFTLGGCLSSFGQNPEGKDLERAEASAHYGDDAFENQVYTPNGFDWAKAKRLARRQGQTFDRDPHGDIPLWSREAQKVELSRPHDSDGVRFTWIGHASVLVQLDGFTILTDPIWSERCSPVGFAGPSRHHAPGVALSDLPDIDAVIISHDHYDHLDEETARSLAKKGVLFVVPLGIGSHLRHWGIERVVELDWWQTHTIEHPDTRESLVLHATPARHFSGRGAIDRNKTLWASWAMVGPKHRAWFGGDTGYFEGFKEIGRRLGPFDLAIIPIGAYDTLWPAVHVNPEEALQMYQDVRAQGMLPIHWGTFNLAFHTWQEPVERAIRASQEIGANLYVPQPGQPLVTSTPATPTTWWQLGADG